MKIFVKLDGDGKVIEACPQEIDGGVEISCTQAQYDKIFTERYDAYSDGAKITSTEAGNDNAKQLELDALAETPAEAPTE